MISPFQKACFVFLISNLLFPFASVGAATKVAHKAKAKPRKTSVSAIKGRDEKVFQNPVSRCLTPTMKKLNTQAAVQMKKDTGGVDGLEFAEAIKVYQQKLEIVWAAMSEPYCGYGSRGVKAVTSSFQKSISRARAEFLNTIKTRKLVTPLPEVVTSSLLAISTTSTR